MMLYLLSLISIANAERTVDKPLLAARLEKIQERKQVRLENIGSLSNKTNFRKYDKNLEFKARALDKIKVEMARANFLKAKENFLAARQRYQTAQLRFLEAKNKTKECEDNENATCNQNRKEIEERAKEHLLNIADMILEHLNKLKAKVEENEDLSEEEANEIIAKIDEEIAEVEEVKSVIETSDSKEEIKEAAKTLKRIWSKIKLNAKVHAGRVVNARIGGIIVKSDHLSVKLEKILERMESKGKNTTSIQPLIDKFNSLIDEAKIKYNESIAKFKEAKESDPPNTTLIREAQESMKEAHKLLQDAQKKLRDIVKSIKQSDGDDELEEAEEEEETSEDEDEDEEESEEGDLEGGDDTE